MADILSTLRELRSLEEKRAHGALSPVEEQRFQELQTSVSGRGPKPGPITPVPPAAAVDQEPPFVDADLTEDVAETQPAASGAEATVVQAAPPEIDKPVPMSSAELRQWNASFSAAEAGGDLAPAVTPDTAVGEQTQIAFAPSAPTATDWLAPTPLDASPEAVPEPMVPEPMVPEPTLPEPSVEVEDAPMVWSEPAPPAASPDIPLLDDGWSVAVAGTSPGEAAPDMELTTLGQASPSIEPTGLGQASPSIEPTGLGQASPSMEPTLADAYEPGPELQRSSDSSSGVTSKRMTPIGEAFAAGESRVVVHMLGGVLKRGSLVDAHMNADFLELRLPDGGKEMLSTAALKAVFFVVPIGQEVPKPVGDPVTVTLQDGHQLVGLSPDYQVGAVGFFLCPSDQRSRTAKIYIYAGAVKGIS
jgi:hypothetical protein